MAGGRKRAPCRHGPAGPVGQHLEGTRRNQPLAGRNERRIENARGCGNKPAGRIPVTGLDRLALERDCVRQRRFAQGRAPERLADPDRAAAVLDP